MLRPSSFGSRPRFLVSSLFDTNNTNIIEHRDASIYILPVPVPLMECVKLILYVPAGCGGFLYLLRL